MRNKTTLVRITQFLLITIFCLQVYSWIININNTNIAYNKYETFLMFKERNIVESNNINFLKKEALENIEIIRNTNRKMHKVSNSAVFIIIPIQATLTLVILILSFWFRTKINY